MASREWMITKVVGLILGLATIVSICIGGANVVVQLRGDVSRNRIEIVDHKKTDEKRFDKIFEDIEINEDNIHRIELQNTRIETNQKDMIRRLDELHRMLLNFEVVP